MHQLGVLLRVADITERSVDVPGEYRAVEAEDPLEGVQSVDRAGVIRSEMTVAGSTHQKAGA